ncbi:MAG: asparagine synthetase B [archaeon]
MCGIIGSFGKVKGLHKAFSLIENRGKDGYGSFHNNKIYKTSSKLKFKSKLKNVKQDFMIHNLHSLVGKELQPLFDKGILVANCEIYNYKELNKKYNFQTKNDAKTLLHLLDKFDLKALDKLDGVYAFAYKNNNKVILVRDLLGVKPLWYSEKPFAFASEKKVLTFLGLKAKELNPRTILKYDIKTNKITTTKRDFYKISPILKQNKTQLIRTLNTLFKDAVKKRLPINKNIGILFSGGIDSTILAMVIKSFGYNPTLYTAAFSDGNLQTAKDLLWARTVSKYLGLKLKVKVLNLKQTEKLVKELIPLIESNDVTKIGVALPFYVCANMAKKDNVKILFSGLGSEEIFAGYERHIQAKNVNKECLQGLKQMHERDLYRDDVIMMSKTIELRLPFLDKKLVAYALRIPANFKVSKEQKKIILRDLAIKLGLYEEIALRKKLAAQYGSNFDKALKKLAKKYGYKKKKQFLESASVP